MASQSNSRLSRRRVLKTGVAALGGGAAWLDATSSAETAQAPGILTGTAENAERAEHRFLCDLRALCGCFVTL